MGGQISSGLTLIRAIFFFYLYLSFWGWSRSYRGHFMTCVLFLHVYPQTTCDLHLSSVQGHCTICRFSLSVYLRTIFGLRLSVCLDRFFYHSFFSSPNFPLKLLQNTSPPIFEGLLVRLNLPEELRKAEQFQQYAEERFNPERPT